MPLHYRYIAVTSPLRRRYIAATSPLRLLVIQEPRFSPKSPLPPPCSSQAQSTFGTDAPEVVSGTICILLYHEMYVLASRTRLRLLCVSP